MKELWKRLIHKKSVRIYFGIAIFVLLLNALAWGSRRFCDAYIYYVFPVWINTYGRFTGLFPFSVGEWLIVAGVVLLVIAVVIGIILVIQYGVHGLLGKMGRKRKVSGKGLLQKFARRFYTFFIWVLLGVCLIMTLNCTILYHASTFEEKYDVKENVNAGKQELGQAGRTESASFEELLAVRNLVAEQCNYYSGLVEREPDGMVQYPGGVSKKGKAIDMQDKAIESMQALGDTYPQLDGYYPRPKALFFSDFMCQQYMQGYYFPFSLEANYNDVMHIMNKPSSMCHELAHLRGYIYEDEATFISFLACIQSDDIYFQYAGYLSVLNYLENDIYKEYQANPEIFAQAVESMGYVKISDQVHEDNIFVEQTEWDRIEGKAVLSTETVDELSDTFIDTSLKVNGVSDGKVSYSRVVELLIWYYGEM